MCSTRIRDSQRHCCRYSGQVALLRWLLSEDATQQLLLGDVVMLIAAAADCQQYACMWQLNTLTSRTGVLLPPPSTCAMVIAAAHTQHYEQGVQLWRSLDPDVADQAAADDALLLQAATTCLHKSGACQAALQLYGQQRGRSPSVGCSSTAIDACAQLEQWDLALQIFDDVPVQQKMACNVEVVAHAAMRTGGHAAVCALYFSHFKEEWRGLQGGAQCLFLTCLHAEGHVQEETALLSHLQSTRATFPQAVCCCMPILTLRGQWQHVIDNYFIIKGAGLPISPHIYSCVIKACAEQAISFATFATILEGARLSNLPLSPSDWDHAATAASHGASAPEMYSLVCEACAAGHTLSAAPATALVHSTSLRTDAAQVVQLLKLLPLPLPRQCVAAAAAALVKEDLWEDALTVLESGSRPLSLAAPHAHDFSVVERCSKLFKMLGIPTDVSFTKAALRCRCIDFLAASDSEAAAQLIVPALRNSLVDVYTCVEVILSLASDADVIATSSNSPKPGTSAGGVVQQRQRAQAAAERAAVLRQHAIAVFEMAGTVFPASQLGQAVDCIVTCLHAQQQPQALIDTFDVYLNAGQKLCDRSYAAAVVACEALGMHERALALLSEIHRRDLHLTALRAGSRCAMACGQRRLALDLHAESIEAEQRTSADNIAWGDSSIIPPAVTPPMLPHSPGKFNRHASFFPSSPTAR